MKEPIHSEKQTGRHSPDSTTKPRAGRVEIPPILAHLNHEARLLSYMQSASPTEPLTKFIGWDLGVTHPAGRISELKNNGHNIVTIRKRAQDNNGEWHEGIAHYYLMQSKGGDHDSV